MIVKHLKQVSPGTKLFLAEGNSESGFIQKILDSIGDNTSQVYCFGGLGNLGTVLKNIAGVPGFSKLGCLGLMVDAETNFSARADSIVSHFSNNGIQLNRVDLNPGFAQFDTPCRIGIFISPGAGLTGRIEDMILHEIKNSPLDTCIAKYSTCVAAASGNSLDIKGIIQSYISAKKGDLCGVGRAFAAGVFDIGNSAYDVPRTLFSNL